MILQLLSQRHFLYMCTFVIALGLASFYSGWRATIFNDFIYVYESNGLVLADEPIDIFNRNIGDLIDRSQPGYDQALRKLRFKLAHRNISQYQNFSDYMGESYIQTVPQGKRLFRFDTTKHIPNRANGLLQFIGVLLLTLGVIGFFIERRIFK